MEYEKIVIIYGKMKKFEKKNSITKSRVSYRLKWFFLPVKTRGFTGKRGKHLDNRGNRWHFPYTH